MEIKRLNLTFTRNGGKWYIKSHHNPFRDYEFNYTIYNENKINECLVYKAYDYWIAVSTKFDLTITNVYDETLAVLELLKLIRETLETHLDSPMTISYTNGDLIVNDLVITSNNYHKLEGLVSNEDYQKIVDFHTELCYCGGTLFKTGLNWGECPNCNWEGICQDHF